MALEYIATSQIWNGEPINGVRHPPSIEHLWTAEQLSEIGLRIRGNPLPTLADAKEAKIAEAWRVHTQRFAQAVVHINVGGFVRPYGCDPTTRENMIAIVNAITAAPNLVPNPRPFTPKGQSTPVMTTHQEFIAIYLAGLAKGDAFYAAYAAHKAAIKALTTVEAVQAYDLSVGWPT